MLTVTTLYAALNVLLVVSLTLLVVHHRIEHHVSLGDGGHDGLARAIRAHGNLVENAPFALVLLALLEWNGLSVWSLHLLGGGFTVARLAHVYGILTATLTPRSLGAVATATLLMAMSGLALIQVLV